jgi:flagellar operon protein (TIGR03826 family)
MGELTNCPKCGEIFVQSQFRTICQKCWKEEEAAYETVYQYIRKRENRTATMEQVVEATGIEEGLLLKFIKEGRLKLNQFPNLGYPCEKCGKSIRQGRLCDACTEDLRKQIQVHSREEERQKELAKKEKHATYFSVDDHFKRGH